MKEPANFSKYFGGFW